MAADPSHSSPTVAATGDSLLAPATDAPDAVLPVAAPDLDTEFGFQRPELGKEKLAGTVGFHERHVFLCFKGPEEWPSHVEATQSDSLPGLLAAALKARKPNLKKSTKLTICEGEDDSESTVGDVLIFPDMIRYRGLTHSDVDNFVEEVLVKDVEWGPGSPEAIKGSYVFVCCHGSRDKRCGVCGPALIKRFKEDIEGQGLDGQVAVSACSHVGGHKYAGNVIIFSSDAKGEVTGHWYGYVAPDDVPVLLNKHIGQGEIIDHLWRGQLGLSEEQQKEALELRHMTNGVTEEESSEANGTADPACNRWSKLKAAKSTKRKATKSTKRKATKRMKRKAKRSHKATKRSRKAMRRRKVLAMEFFNLPDSAFNVVPTCPPPPPMMTRRKKSNRKHRQNAAGRKLRIPTTPDKSPQKQPSPSTVDEAPQKEPTTTPLDEWTARRRPGRKGPK